MIKNVYMKKIDFVIPYVNLSDPAWIELAIENNVFGSSAGNNINLRYRDDGTIGLVIESIRKFCPFCKTIWLIVQSESQVPEELKNKVSIILHKDFIPEEYLPTFNSSCIEMFLPFLPGVSDEFIYLNDDIVYLRPTKYSDYFCNTGNGYYPRHNVKIKRTGPSQGYLKVNCYNIIMGVEQNFYQVSSQHNPTPFNKKTLLECFELYKNEILGSISRVKRDPKNLNQYLFSFYDFCYYHTKKMKQKSKCFKPEEEDYEKFNWKNLGKYDTICLNSISDGDISKYINKVEKYIRNYES